MNLLCEIQRERRTALIVATHDSDVAARAPRTVELVDGRVAGALEP